MIYYFGGGTSKSIFIKLITNCTTEDGVLPLHLLYLHFTKARSYAVNSTVIKI